MYAVRALFAVPQRGAGFRTVCDRHRTRELVAGELVAGELVAGDQTQATDDLRVSDVFAPVALASGARHLKPIL